MFLAGAYQLRKNTKSKALKTSKKPPRTAAASKSECQLQTGITTVCYCNNNKTSNMFTTTYITDTFETVSGNMEMPVSSKPFKPLYNRCIHVFRTKAQMEHKRTFYRRAEI